MSTHFTKNSLNDLNWYFSTLLSPTISFQFSGGLGGSTNLMKSDKDTTKCRNNVIFLGFISKENKTLCLECNHDHFVEHAHKISTFSKITKIQEFKVYHTSKTEFSVLAQGGAHRHTAGRSTLHLAPQKVVETGSMYGRHWHRSRSTITPHHPGQGKKKKKKNH